MILTQDDASRDIGTMVFNGSAIWYLVYFPASKRDVHFTKDKCTSAITLHSVYISVAISTDA